MNKYEQLAEAMAEFINEAYRLTGGNDDRTIANLADLIVNELSIADLMRLDFHIGVAIESRTRDNF